MTADIVSGGWGDTEAHELSVSGCIDSTDDGTFDPLT
jgi:hypothetical protein